MITLAQFYRELKRTPRDWSLDSAGVIQRNGTECPALAVQDLLAEKDPTYRLWPILLTDKPGAVDVTRLIFQASDNFPGHSTAIRQNLLLCTGLA